MRASVSMSEACNDFTQHAWKHELCSNCMKPRDKHAAPVPAKRPAKAPKPLPHESPSKNGSSDQGNNGLLKQKPEARVKPTIAAKPGSPDLDGKSTGRAKPAVNVVRPNVVSKVKPQEREEEEESGRESPVFNKSDGHTDTIKRAGASAPVRADGAYDDVPKPKPVPPSELRRDPFYDEYDVSFKGMSGKPMPIGAASAQARNRSLDRLKNDVEVVMPYNVVDVSTDPPVKDPDSPGRGNSPLAAGGKGFGGSPQSRRRGGSPQFQRNLKIIEGASKSPNIQRRAAAPGPDNGYYEDVEDPDYVENTQPFVRNSPLRTSNQKSAVFEAKLSTIAQSLDLSKKGTKDAAPEPVAAPKPIPPPSSGECSPTLTGKKDKKKGKDELKQEKHRKGSAGKSFFKKLFGRGGNESEETESGQDVAVSCDSDGAGGKTDDEGSTKGSAPPSVEGSPMLSQTRHPVEPENKDPGKKVGRVESLKDQKPTMFSAELRQALAKTSKIGEKNITASVEKIRETKREEVIASEVAFSELKGSPLFDRRMQKSEHDKSGNAPINIEGSPQRLEAGPVGDPGRSSPGKLRKSLVIEGGGAGPIVHGATAPMRRPTDDTQMEHTHMVEPPKPPAPPPKQEAPPKPDTKPKPRPETAAKPEVKSKSENKPKLDGTIKRRPAPAAPPPPVPEQTHKRNSSCTSPVSPRPMAPPPPSPKPPPDLPPELPPILPEKTANKKRNSLKADEMMGYAEGPPKGPTKRMEISAPQPLNLPPAPPSPKLLPPPPPDPVPPPSPDLPAPPPPPPEMAAPRLPEKSYRKRNSLKCDDLTSGQAAEVYGKRPEISAPRLQRTSAVLDGVVDAGLGASIPGEPTVSAASSKSVSPTVSPSSTLTHDRKQRPRSEISEGKSGTLRRKPDRAPPPPPAPPDRRLSTNDISPTDDLIKCLSRTSSEDASRKTHTFPREGNREREPIMGGTLGRQTQGQRPRVRTDRAQTLSEGMGCDLQDFNATVLKHDTITDLTNELKELTGKFGQRKLPSPPKDVYYGPENYYETVHSEDEENSKTGNKTRIKGDAITQMRERERRDRSLTPYEDVDGECYDDMDLSRRKKDISPAMVRAGSEKASEMVAKSIQRASTLPPTQNPVMTSSAEYLQPVAHDHSPQEECLSHPPMVVPQAPPHAHPIPLVMNLSGSSMPDSVPLLTASTLQDHNRGEWRPKPIPRKPQGSPSSSSASSYVFLYAEDGSELGPRDFEPGEGWARLAGKHVSVLEQIRFSLDSIFVGAPVSASNLRWDDFTLESFVPVFSNMGISFYRATTNRLHLKECLLMLSLRPLPTEVPVQTHLGVLHPNALYQDHVSALLFPDNTADPHVYGQCGKVPTTVWILPFASVCSFEEYCIGLRGLYATKLPIFHRHLCSAFQQALSAILYLLNKECNLHCFRGDEILGVTPLGGHETFVTALPHHCHLSADSVPDGQLALYLHQLLLRLLDDQYLASACGVSLNHSRYFRGLIQVAKVLSRNTTQNLFKAQLMCEFLLWGPGEQELQAILSSHNPQSALSVWLELERAKVIGKYAIEDFSATKEDAHRVHFLVLLSDQTLWDTVQLLLQD